jgi:hypothetical protein
MSVPLKLIILKRNTNLIFISISNAVTGLPINDAVGMKCNLFDRSGQAVATFPTDLSMTYVTASAGQYQAVVPGTFDAAKGGGYLLKIDGQDSNGNLLHEEKAVEVHTRTS